MTLSNALSSPRPSHVFFVFFFATKVIFVTFISSMVFSLLLLVVTIVTLHTSTFISYGTDRLLPQHISSNCRIMILFIPYRARSLLSFFFSHCVWLLPTSYRLIRHIYSLRHLLTSISLLLPSSFCLPTTSYRIFSSVKRNSYWDRFPLLCVIGKEGEKIKIQILFF